jgi:diadenosine tetraphosphate (Ap4A) HIT family hydrolase
MFMHSYAPTNYRCPFCILTDVDDENAYSGKTDIVYHNDEVTAFISPHQCPGSPGSTIVIPNIHIGNMHDLPIYLAICRLF